MLLLFGQSYGRRRRSKNFSYSLLFFLHTARDFEQLNTGTSEGGRSTATLVYVDIFSPVTGIKIRAGAGAAAVAVYTGEIYVYASTYLASSTSTSPLNEVMHAQKTDGRRDYLR